MSDSTTQELNDLILNLEKNLLTPILTLHKKFELQLIEFGSEIKEVRAEIQQAETRLEAEIKPVESKLVGEIKRIEEKLTEKMDGLGKRLVQQEFVSCGAVITLLGGVATAGCIPLM